MAEPVFFAPPAPLTIAEIAELTGARPTADADLGRPIAGVAGLERAGPGDITYFENRRLVDLLTKTRAGACFCHPRFAVHVPAGTIALETTAPQRAYAAVGARLFPAAIRPGPVTASRGISAAAHVDASAVLEAGVTVEPAAVIGPGAEIGRGTIIGPGAVVGPGVRIGRDAFVGSGVSIGHALIGNRVILHPGVRIGQDGFGFVPGATGHAKIAQIGRVIIQDDVEIGANSTVDRGAGRDTVIGEGTKIDNLVQIGHNVVIGRHCLIAGQAGISGSVTIGDFVMLGGQSGVREHISIGHGARVAAKAGVTADIPAGEAWVGAPAQPMRQFQRELRALKRLARGAGQTDGEAGSAERGEGSAADE